MRLTVGKKLNSLIGVLQLLSIAAVVILATGLFTDDLTGLLRKETLDTSAMLSGRVRAEMKHVADRARMLGAASLEDYKYEEDKLKFIQDNLSTDAQYIGLALYRRQTADAPSGTAAASGVAAASGITAASGLVKAGTFSPVWRIAHPEAVKKLKLAQADFVALDRDFPLDLEEVGKGGIDFTIAKMKDGTSTLRMAIPLVQQKDGTFSQLLVIELQQERLTGLFAEATGSTSFLVDKKGRVLASTDPSKFPAGDDLSAVPIVAALSQGKGQGGQTDFKDREGATQIGAFQRVGFADLTVIAQIPLARAETAKKMLYRRTALMGGFFLSMAMILGLLFSRTLTGPIQALAAAAESVAKGDFTVRLKTKDKGARDEIQEFSKTFNEMVTGLEERDKVKATFAKFHSKEMADKVLSGELHLGGERKTATVFFSDVRGFTALSEGMDPEALVKILNRYMTRMVRVIIENGGIVDKYVGDAIMAVWGVPMSKDDDTFRALRACLGMRKALAELNAEFISEGIPPVKIGMGLNFGNLISGNIGSEERMEFTVIGDTVNTASRIESLTKEFGTDLLISREVLEQVQGRFVVEKAHEAKVKGKSEPLAVYKVHGYIDENGKEVIVETPYSAYMAEHSDKVVHDKPKKKEGEHAEAPAPATAVPAALETAPVAAPASAAIPATASASASAAVIAISAEPPVPLFAAYADRESKPVAATTAIAVVETFMPDGPAAPAVAAHVTPVKAAPPATVAPRFRHVRARGSRRRRRLQLIHSAPAVITTPPGAEEHPVSLERAPRGGGVSFAAKVAWKAPITLAGSLPKASPPLPRFARDLEMHESLAVHFIRAPYEPVSADHALLPAEEAIPKALQYVADDQGVLPLHQDADEVAAAAAVAVLDTAVPDDTNHAMTDGEEPSIPITDITVIEAEEYTSPAPIGLDPPPTHATPIRVEYLMDIFPNRFREVSSGEMSFPIGGLVDLADLEAMIACNLKSDHASTINLDPPPEDFDAARAPISLEAPVVAEAVELSETVAPAVVEAPAAVEVPATIEAQVPVEVPAAEIAPAAPARHVELMTVNGNARVHTPAAVTDSVAENTYSSLDPVTDDSIVREIHEAPKAAEKPLDSGPFREALVAEVHDMLLYRRLEGELKTVRTEIAELKTLLNYYEEVMNKKRAG